jgi:membrane-bound lytic murein transglycosylase D
LLVSAFLLPAACSVFYFCNMFNFKNIFLVILIISGSVVQAVAQGSRYKNPVELGDENKVAEYTNTPVRVYAPKVPTAYTLFGEKVPLNIVDVRERLDRELVVNTYMQGSTIQIIKQMGRWLPAIEARLKANGVPDDFKYLCIAESALQQAVSKVGASGFWQFMKATGPSYGLEINDNVDERYNVNKATDAACKYLLDAFNKFGNWTAAAASYNCGMGGYNGAINNQGVTNFYDVLLPEETMRYVFRIMALKYILENPARSGFMIEPSDMYKPYKTKIVAVNYNIASLVNFALENNTNYKTIKLYNPWLRDKFLHAMPGKNYDLLLPAQ